jgi:hypothetical protein
MYSSRKRLRLMPLCLLLCVASLFAQTKPDINRYTSGNLSVSRILPGVSGQCLTTDISGHTAWATCASGGGGGYATIQNAAAAITQRAIINWVSNIVCSDNSGASRSDCNLASTISTSVINATTGFEVNGAAGAGKVLIGDGTNFVPGDPFVQGVHADGSTVADNPVVIGGYDTAGTPALHRGTFINGTPGGTEYGIVTRNIPSGTQTVSGSVSVSNFPATQPVSGTVTTSPPSNASTNVAQINGVAPLMGNGVTGTGSQRVTIASDNTAFGVKLTDGTNTQAVKAASTAAAATDPSSVTQLSPNQPQLTTPLNVQGAKTNNNAAPGATNIGTLPGIANAAPPSFTEGNQGALSIDLKGNLRVYGHPPDVLGCYMVNGRTSTYAALSAATPLFSYRWGDATHFAVIQRVRVTVATTVASNANSGQAERELIVARGFTASDTGGTAVTLTGNNQKMRTNQATSLVTDMRFGTTITAGTRTLDANPISSVVAWLGVNFTGVDIGCGGGAAATAAAWTCAGGLGFVDLLNATNGQSYPLVLAQNEGFIVRVGKDAMPTGFTQQTYIQVDWCEVNAY